MKTLQIYLVIFIAGMLTMALLMSTFQKEQIVTVEIPAVIDTVILKKPYPIVDTIVIRSSDTTYIDSTTPLGEIPIRQEVIKITTPVKVNGHHHEFMTFLTVHYRGILHGYESHIIPAEFKVKIKELHKPRFYLNAGIVVNGQKEVLPEMEGGIMLGRRFSAFFRYSNQLNCGIKVWF